MKMDCGLRDFPNRSEVDKAIAKLKKNNYLHGANSVFQNDPEKRILLLERIFQSTFIESNGNVSTLRNPHYEKPNMSTSKLKFLLELMIIVGDDVRLTEKHICALLPSLLKDEKNIKVFAVYGDAIIHLIQRIPDEVNSEIYSLLRLGLDLYVEKCLEEEFEYPDRFERIFRPEQYHRILSGYDVPDFSSLESITRIYRLVAKCATIDEYLLSFLTGFLKKQNAALTSLRVDNLGGLELFRQSYIFFDVVFLERFDIELFRKLEEQFFIFLRQAIELVIRKSSLPENLYHNQLKKEPIIYLIKLFTVMVKILHPLELSSEFKVLFQNLFDVFRIMAAEDMLTWQHDTIKEFLCCLKELMIYLNISEEVNLNRAKFSTKDIYVRTEQDKFNTKYLDTVLLTPVIHILTRYRLSKDLRKAAFSLLGVLGPIDPKMIIINNDQHTKTTYSDNFFFDERQLAEDELPLQQMIYVKDAFQHSGYVRITGKKTLLNLPILPNERYFNVRAIVLILIEKLKYHLRERNELICVKVVDVLSYLIPRFSIDFEKSSLRLFKAMEKILLKRNNDYTFHSYKANDLDNAILKLIGLLGYSYFGTDQKFPGHVAFVKRAIPFYFQIYPESMCLVAETYSSILGCENKSALWLTSFEIAKYLRKSCNNPKTADTNAIKAILTYLEVVRDYKQKEVIAPLLLNYLVGSYNLRDQTELNFKILEVLRISKTTFSHKILANLLKKRDCTVLKTKTMKDFYNENPGPKRRTFAMQSYFANNDVKEDSLEEIARRRIEVNYNEMEEVIEFMKEFIIEETHKLEKLETVSAQFKHQKYFVKRLCSSLLKKCAHKCLRACSILAASSIFIAEEMLNLALLDIVLNMKAFDANSDDVDESLEDRFYEEMVKLTKNLPAGKHFLLDFQEFGERGGFKIFENKLSHLASIARDQADPSKSIRLLENELTAESTEQKVTFGSVDQKIETKKKLVTLYHEQNLATFTVPKARFQSLDNRLFKEEEKDKELNFTLSEINEVLQENSLTKDKLESWESSVRRALLRNQRKSYEGLYKYVTLAYVLAEIRNKLELRVHCEKWKHIHSASKYWSLYKARVELASIKRLEKVSVSDAERNLLLTLHDALVDSETKKKTWLRLCSKSRKTKALSHKAFYYLTFFNDDDIVEQVKSENCADIIKAARQLDLEAAFEVFKLYWSQRKKEMVGIKNIFYLVSKGLLNIIEDIDESVKSRPDVNESSTLVTDLKKLKSRVLLKLAKISFELFTPDENIRQKTRKGGIGEIKKDMSSFQVESELRKVEEYLLEAQLLDNTKYKTCSRLVQYYEYKVVNAESSRPIPLKRSLSTSSFGVALEDPNYFGLKRTYREKLLESLFCCIKLGEYSKNTRRVMDPLKFLNTWSKLPFEKRVASGKIYFTKEKLGKYVNNFLPILAQLISSYVVEVEKEIRSFYEFLLVKIGIKYSQFSVYDFLAATSDENNGISEIIKTIKASNKSSEAIFDEAEMFVSEIQRVAITPAERWYYELNRARGEKQRNKIEEMEEIFTSLRPTSPPTELPEINFRRKYRKHIKSLYEYFDAYRLNRTEEFSLKLWDAAYAFCHALEKRFEGLKQIDLVLHSPLLYRKKNWCLAVPRTLLPGAKDDEIITIKRIESNIQVLKSKKRPRKIFFIGSNNKRYPFLLKGYEDLRQDQRLMQFFGIVNCLTKATKLGKREDLSMVRFPIIPLSPIVGLVGWVQRAKTMYEIVREYRGKFDMPVEAELEEFLSYREYEELPLHRKIKIFCQIRDKYDSMEIARAMLAASRTSEIWLKRRRNFVNSLGVSSVVGYLLGIGDRHPSNIMIGFDSGKVFHIDFGDSFGAASYRDLKPEKVPFRLTPMLVNGMGPDVVDGPFRVVCEHTLKVLRKHKTDIIDILSPFINNPLKDWFEEENMKTLAAVIKNDVQKNMPFPGFEFAQHKLPSSIGSFEKPLASSIGEIAQSPVSFVASGKATGDLFFYTKNKAVRTESFEAKSSRKLEDDQGKNDFQSIIINRIDRILQGKEKGQDSNLTVEEQIDSLIKEARDVKNLCQMYSGWVPFW